MASTFLVLTMFKNGNDFQAGVGGAQVDAYTGTGTVVNNGSDVASGTDYYELMVYMTTTDGASNGALNNDPRHVWWNGISFG